MTQPPGRNDAAIEDLRVRLHQTRWPEPQTVDDWSQGTPRRTPASCAGTGWKTTTGPRRTSGSISSRSSWPPSTAWTSTSSMSARHIPAATPLVLTHGWPGSVVEFFKVIGPLTDPVAHGGRSRGRLPCGLPVAAGLRLQRQADQAPGWGTQRIADAWDQLMARLGYPRYGAQGGDWGARVTMDLGLRHPGHLIGIHLNMVPRRRPRAVPRTTSPRPRGPPSRRSPGTTAGGHRVLQGAVDPPADRRLRPRSTPPPCLAAWIVEKFHAWSDRDGDPANVIQPGRDARQHHALLAARHRARPRPASTGRASAGQPSPIAVPGRLLHFPQGDLPAVPPLGEPQFPQLRYWNELAKGGHFAASSSRRLLHETRTRPITDTSGRRQLSWRCRWVPGAA